MGRVPGARVCVASRGGMGRVILARLRRFRLGADGSPAPSAQALQPDQADAPHSAGKPETRSNSRRRGVCLEGYPGRLSNAPRREERRRPVRVPRPKRSCLARRAHSATRRAHRQQDLCVAMAFPRTPFASVRQRRCSSGRRKISAWLQATCGRTTGKPTSRPSCSSWWKRMLSLSH